MWDLNVTYHNDTAFDEIVTNFRSASDAAEAKKFLLEADMYYLRAHWCVETFPVVTFNVWQPYFKGYSGEFFIWGEGQYWMRFWVDQELKESMGHSCMVQR